MLVLIDPLKEANANKQALDSCQTTLQEIDRSLSVADILAVLYFEKMRVDPKDSKNPDRDRFVLSKGHCTPALYPTLALRGFFPEEDLKLFRSIEGHISGHAEMRHVNGVDMSTGSLGQGLSVAVGMALAGKLDKKDYRVYAVMGDGEIDHLFPVTGGWNSAPSASRAAGSGCARGAPRASSGRAARWPAATSPPRPGARS